MNMHNLIYCAGSQEGAEEAVEQDEDAVQAEEPIDADDGRRSGVWTGYGVVCGSAAPLQLTTGCSGI